MEWVISTMVAFGLRESITPFIMATYASCVPKSVSSVIGGAMTRLRNRHNQHGEDNEETGERDCETEQGLLDTPSGSEDRIGLSEYAAKTASVNLQEDDGDEGDSNQHLTYS